VTPSEKVRSEAAFWVERMNRPAFDAKDGAAFDAWMRSHAEHREAFAAMAAMWDDGFPKIDAIADAEPTEGPVLPAKRRRPGKRLGIAASLVGFATAALIALAFVPATLPRSYSSQPGQPAMIRLADGSTVRLGGNSQIEVQYLPWRRTVRLARGEAGFEVAHDRRRPFGVDAGEVDVVVLGTAFFVDRLANGRVGVAVTRGAVAVRTPGSADRLGPGQAVRVTERGIERVAMQLEDSQWSSGWFVARNIPLSDLIEKLRRYSTEPIVLSDTRLENRMIVGRFKISSPDTVLKGIESSYNLNISRKPGSIHIRSQN
jgi:transmembrane sensor